MNGLCLGVKTTGLGTGSIIEGEHSQASAMRGYPPLAECCLDERAHASIQASLGALNAHFVT